MMRRFVVLHCVLLLSVLPVSGDTTTLTRQTLDAVILVSDRFTAADDIETWVDNNGGYLISRIEDRLVFRVPSSELDEFVDFLESSALETIQVRQRTEDISQRLLEVQAGVRSKQQLFEQAMALIDDSDLATTLEIESEILSVLGDIEELKGELSKLEGEGALARVQVDLSLEQETLPENLPSAFPWINAVDLRLLIGEFSSR
jgi:hypothetical protein